MSNLRKVLAFIYTWTEGEEINLHYIPFGFSDTILNKFNLWLWRNLWNEVSDTSIQSIITGLKNQYNASLYPSNKDWLRDYVHSDGKNLPEFMRFVYDFVGPTSPLTLQFRWGRRCSMNMIPPEIRVKIMALTKSFYLNYLLKRLYDSQITSTIVESFCNDNADSANHLVRFQTIMNSPMEFVYETKLLDGAEISIVKPVSWFTVYACLALHAPSPILNSLFWTKPRECNWYLISEYDRYHNSRMEEVD